MCFEFFSWQCLGREFQGFKMVLQKPVGDFTVALSMIKSQRKDLKD